MESINEQAILNPKAFRQKVTEEILRAIASDYEKPTEEELGKATAIGQRVCAVINTHAKAQKVLNRDERNKIELLKRRVEYLKRRMRERDPEVTEKLKKEHGEHYIDFDEVEATAVKWAIKFIEEHSL